MAKHNSPNTTESPSNTFLSSTSRYCCFPLPSFRPSDGAHIWYPNPLTALKKLREWSEIVAGPKWKTFIRRFNRNNKPVPASSNFQYDPLSYALNFDDGAAKIFISDEHLGHYPDFASRFVSPNPSSKNEADLGRAVAAAV